MKLSEEVAQWQKKNKLDFGVCISATAAASVGAFVNVHKHLHMDFH